MDDLKVIQGRNFSKFLEVEIQTDPFGENRSGERAYRRAERLVAAIFLLTNHIDAGERLRQEIRSNSIALLDHILGLRDEMRASVSPRAGEFQMRVRILISQVRMLVFGGFVSSQNSEAVCGALDELGNFIHLSQRSGLSESIQFSKEDLLLVRDFHKGHIRDIKDTKIVRDKEPVSPALSTSSIQKDGADALPLTTRTTSILAVLRSGGEMSIRDIAANLPEYGEKTIQRELGTLIGRGFIRRSGLKRWSRYAIAQ